MLPFHSDTHLPKPTPPPPLLAPCPSSHQREKLKQANPRFFFVVVFLSSPPPLFSFLHIGPSLSVYLSSSLPPTLPGHCTGQDGSHDTLWDVTPPPFLIHLLLPSFVSHHIPQMTAASTHSHFHLCISRERQCVVCMWRRYISTPIKGYLK